MNVSTIKAFLFKQLSECIIQSRSHITKEQMMKFQAFVTDMSKYKHKSLQSASMFQMLQTLIMTPKLQSQFPIPPNPQMSNILITINLQKNNTLNKVVAQIWEIKVSEKFSSQTAQTCRMLANLFQETLLLLNKQPLFSEYQKNSKIRQQYKITHNIFIKNQANQYLYDKFYSYISVLAVNHRYSSARSCLALNIELEYYSLDTLKNLEHITTMGQKCQKLLNKLIHFQTNLFVSQRQTIHGQNKQLQFGEGKDSGDYGGVQDVQFMVIEEYEEEEDKPKIYRKMSLFEYYDTSLEMTVLSNDQKSFTSSPKNTLRELEIEIQIEQQAPNFDNIIKVRTRSANLELDDDHFELLDFSKDEKLIEDNKFLLQQFVQAEKLRQKMESYENFN